MNKLIVFQSDFGLVDGAVSAMHGVANVVDDSLKIFDLTHDIPQYSIWDASYRLYQTTEYWPRGTVFVSVVDPGVGSKRLSVVAETVDGHFIVTPDNGTLTHMKKYVGLKEVREIDETKHRREDTEYSYTFHGRDVYSYTGARLAAGVITFDQVGPLLEPKVMLLELTPGRIENDVLYGAVAGGVGRLGNVAFNIDRQLFKDFNVSLGEQCKVAIKNQQEVVWEGEIPYVRTFGEVPVGDLLLFVNSSGFMSIAINQGNFASTYGIKAGKNWIVEIAKLP